MARDTSRSISPKLAAALLVATATVASGVRAEPPALVGTFDSSAIGRPQGISVSGPRAYLLINKVLQIVDISVPQTPAPLALLNAGSKLRAVHVSGDRAYLASHRNTAELLVVDVGNPVNPVEVGQYDVDGKRNGTAVFADGTRVYLGTDRRNRAGDHEFLVLDATDPGNILLLGSHEIGARVNDIYLRRNLAYVATAHPFKEIVVLDVSDPTSIEEIATFDAPVGRGVEALYPTAGKVYAVTRNRGSNPDFYVLDATEGLTVLGSADLGTNNTDVVVHGDAAFVSTRSRSAGVVRVDVSDPTAPFAAETLDMLARTTALATHGNHLYALTRERSEDLQVLDPGRRLRPNIIVINTDDQRWDSVTHMSTVVSRLVGGGMVFDNSYVPMSVCCPSRASLFSGQYPHNTGITAQFPGALAFDEASSVAVWLRAAGYTTGLCGKYLNSYANMSPVVPAGWDTWRAFVEDNHMFFNYTVNQDGQHVTYGNLPEDYSTDVLAQMAVSFIDANADDPFFLVFTPFAPHAPAIPAPRHAGMFAGLPPWRPPSYLEPDTSDKPVWVNFVRSARESAPPAEQAAWAAGVDQLRISQLESLLAVDEAIGTILDRLDAHGLGNDTMVVFTSDNGQLWGEHWWADKFAAYEESIRVPLVIRYPPLVPSAQQDARLVSNIDLAPTFADVGGAPIPAAVNGHSLVPMLADASAPWREDLLVEYVQQPFTPIPDYGVVVHDSGWKYILNGGSFEELYDLTTDPLELDNVLITDPGNPAHAAILDQLRLRLPALLSE
jgi:N-acetylglucosamine-6-sulfatase